MIITLTRLGYQFIHGFREPALEDGFGGLLLAYIPE
jgi:hypothetical protein